MSTKSREVIYGSRIRGAEIRAQAAREKAVEAVEAVRRGEMIMSVGLQGAA